MLSIHSSGSSTVENIGQMHFSDCFRMFWLYTRICTFFSEKMSQQFVDQFGTAARTFHPLLSVHGSWRHMWKVWRSFNGWLIWLFLFFFVLFNGIGQGKSSIHKREMPPLPFCLKVLKVETYMLEWNWFWQMFFWVRDSRIC